MTNYIQHITNEQIGSFVEGNALPNEAMQVINSIDSDEALCEVLSLCFTIHAAECGILMN